MNFAISPCCTRGLFPCAFLVCALSAIQAQAVLTENFDVNGATTGFGVVTGTTYDWDDTTNGGFWSNNATSTTGAQATTGWPQGNFPKFQPAGTPTYTVTVSNNEQITGIFASTAQTLTLNPIGSGTLEAIAGDDGFLGSGSADITINVPIKGAGRVAPSNGGNIRFNAANSYTGGTLLATTSSLIHFNNGSAFGSGDITIGVAGLVPLLGSGGATITLPNNFVNTVVGGGINFAADASTPVISSGTWSLGTNNLVLRNNGAATSTLTLSNTISGSGGITLSSNSSGTIFFNAANTGYSGTTSITGPGGTGTGSTIVTLAIGNDSALGTGPLTLAGGVLATSGGPRSIANNTTIVASTAGSSVTPTDNLTFTGTLTNSGGNRILIGTTNAGTTTFTNSVFLSEVTGTGRTLTLDGAGSVNPKFVISGNISNFNGVGGTAGSIQVGNGSAATAATLTLSGTNTHSGATNVSTGSTLKIASAGALGTSTLTFTGSSNFFDNTTGGALVLSNNMALPNGSPTFIGTDNLTLGNLNISAANRTLTVSNNKLSVNNLTETAGPWNFTKAGAGTLEVRGTDSHSGTSVVSGGTWLIPVAGSMTSASAITVSNSGSKLQVDGAITSAGTVTINSGASLIGTGSVAGATAINGTVSPGDSVGAISTLAVGALTFNTGSTFAYDLNSDSLTGDLLKVIGGLTINAGALAVNDAGSTILMGTKFTLINYTGALSGAFDTLAEGATITTPSGNQFVLSYNDPGGANDANLVGGSGNFVTLTAVPEANAFWLGGAICLVLGLTAGTRKMMGVRAVG